MNLKSCAALALAGLMLLSSTAVKADVISEGPDTREGNYAVVKQHLAYVDRLYNPNSGEHHYTTDNGERYNLVYLGWKDEGFAWSLPGMDLADPGYEEFVNGLQPVYRLYNPNNGDHHYTKDENEKNTLVGLGWKDEGSDWNSDPREATPIYRLYNPNAKTASHHYTRDPNEVDALKQMGWKDEGVAWYGGYDNDKDLPAVVYNPMVEVPYRNRSDLNEEDVIKNDDGTDFSYYMGPGKGGAL